MNITTESWMDEVPAQFPFKEGDLMELPHGPHLYYFRVIKEEAGVAIRIASVGGITNGNIGYDPK